MKPIHTQHTFDHAIRYEDVLNILDKIEDEERRNCENYCFICPEAKAEREHQREIYLGAILEVKYALHNFVKRI